MVQYVSLTRLTYDRGQFSYKSSGEKIISTGELLNFYQNINSTGGFSFPLEKIAFQNGEDLSSYKEQNSTGGFFFNSLEECSVCTKRFEFFPIVIYILPGFQLLLL